MLSYAQGALVRAMHPRLTGASPPRVLSLAHHVAGG